MPESSKLTDRAAELANQAAAAAGPLAAQAKERAGVLAAQAAAAAGPLAEQARVRAAQGVDVLAGNLDRFTGGKYSEQIHSVAARVGGALDTNPKPASTVPAEPPVPPAPPPTSTGDQG
jgi:hypothetical protein